MTVAVVIPALNEEAHLPRTLAQTAALGFDRILVVDGGSIDRTRDIVQQFSAKSSLTDLSDAIRSPHASWPRQDYGGQARLTPQGVTTPITLLSSPAGRARQMNAGAASSDEDVVLFLHADTALPTNAREAIDRALQDPACVGGRFDLRFDREGAWAWLISRFMNRRSRWTGIATGDQAIFVRRVIFERLNGFADLPLMEDVDFTRRLKRTGRVAALGEQVTTSFRRWERTGPLRTILLMWTLRFLYWAGVSPQTLSAYYRVVR